MLNVQHKMQNTIQPKSNCTFSQEHRLSAHPHNRVLAPPEHRCHCHTPDRRFFPVHQIHTEENTEYSKMSMKSQPSLECFNIKRYPIL